MINRLSAKYRRHLFYLYQIFTILLICFGVFSFICMIVSANPSNGKYTGHRGSLLNSDSPDLGELKVDEYANFIRDRDIKDLQGKRVEDDKRLDLIVANIDAIKAVQDKNTRSIDSIYNYGAALGTVLGLMLTLTSGLKNLLAKSSELKIRDTDK